MDQGKGDRITWFWRALQRVQPARLSGTRRLREACMTDTSAQAAAPSPSTVRKVALAAMAGSAIEWYDFFIYLTAAALIFGPLYFPGASEVAAVLASFSTAAVGFVARPVGGILFGHFGDKLGRKPTLVIALLTMGTATTLVGLLRRTRP